ncbi:OLC1v1030993C1 [Oldenlandia corymbosa var. corymbosa]|uniref:OLC1v1030993C1 n=1 Tax=Oldenlandia corymbosa var. corymbosa TaxID=529605 RepID=A0AAV1CKP0_OLDCO|nr:OLC1v1030993C1 [Oldenlandia corymbosa var. corymbosa]
MAAILSLGLIGARPKNARIAGMLRNLASYYHKEAKHSLYYVLAQGWVHMGKAGEKAELATEEYIPLSPILEDVVILMENVTNVED